MTSVGVSPRHSVVGPSLRAILRMPSHVLVKVLRDASSAAHSACERDEDAGAEARARSGVGEA